MYPASRLQFRALFVVALAAAVFTFGCHKKPEQAPPPPPAPPPPAAKPTVSLQANPSSINKGDSSTLTWTSSNATSVTISPEVGAVTAEGSTKVTPSDSTTYTITASGPGGSADASASSSAAGSHMARSLQSGSQGRLLRLRQVRPAPRCSLRAQPNCRFLEEI